MSIPKVIYYCWFGRQEKPELAIKCISSWKDKCPDYQIIEINEDNFDVSCNAYCKRMYDDKKWAFLTDYVRLKLIYENGGIYFDTDVELLKSLDIFLNYDAFFGLEENKFINTGLGFGSIKQNELIKKNLEYYEKLVEPIISVKCPDITTQIFIESGLIPSDKVLINENVAIFPSEYFSPKDYYTEKIRITKNTVSIHHFSRSWCEPETRKQSFLRRHPFINKIIHLPNKLGMLILKDKYNSLKKILKGNNNED